MQRLAILAAFSIMAAQVESVARGGVGR